MRERRELADHNLRLAHEVEADLRASEARVRALVEGLEYLDIQALASAVHDARYRDGQHDSHWTPFSAEPESGAVYCLRIAHAVSMHLIRTLLPAADGGSGEQG